ncbi:MAG: DNA replication and repair protein RecF [Balneolaceae bacterium]|nr:MAG: DNA replication and repair protein RecF [Balneolaceae bacterium]
MNIRHLKLRFFRNHAGRDLRFSPGLNLLTGPNGTGKTNILDAIHYLCMSRSFVSGSDQYVVMQGESGFRVDGEFEGSIRSSFRVTCNYSRGEGKKIFVNDSPLDRLADLIGMVPVVVLSPDDKRLTSEGPAERRSFLDAMISQISKSYLSDLIDYRRIVKQRNRLLSDPRYRSAELNAFLEPWNRQLVQTGSRIILKRASVLNQFAHYLQETYDLISGIGHRPHFFYKTISTETGNLDDLEQHFSSILADEYERERDREQTVAGPHRDDLIFYLDDQELRKFGSQGQHRLFALALKLAQLRFYSEHLDDLPVLLLDDVFGDLDPHKTNILVRTLMDQNAQTFITAANPEPFRDLVEHGDDYMWYIMENGELKLHN